MLCLSVATMVSAQDGRVLKKEVLVLPDNVVSFVIKYAPALAVKLDSINFYKISYLSDGLKVTGYVAEPKAPGKYPCIISNRGGNRDFGQWNTAGVAIFLGNMASWGYVVIASQYRGVDGGEGQEEFGGNDVHDVLNLVPALAYFAKADTSRIGIEGGSRGGMMTYLALKKSCRFKAASVIAGVANSFRNIQDRPDMDTFVYGELVPHYQQEKEIQLKARSAVFWADSMCKTTPLLIMHGSADWRVHVEESLELVQKLVAFKHPVRFILYEGADHSISEFRKESLSEIRRHFDYYVRDGGKLPDMKLHGL